MISSFHKNNITRQYTGLPVIDPRNPRETASFVEEAYTSYLGQKDVHGLDIAIEAYLDAKRESTYLDTRALRAVVVLEFLKSRYATEKGIEFILPSSPFKKASHKVKHTLEEHFREMSLPEDTLREMKSKIGELNRRSFKSILETMFDDLGVTITEENLDRFVKIRNSLVHKGSFLTKESWQEYTFLISILDRIFLRILNYAGFYLDIADKSKRIETNPPKA